MKLSPVFDFTGEMERSGVTNLEDNQRGKQQHTISYDQALTCFSFFPLSLSLCLIIYIYIYIYIFFLYLNNSEVRKEEAVFAGSCPKKLLWQGYMQGLRKIGAADRPAAQKSSPPYPIEPDGANKA